MAVVQVDSKIPTVEQGTDVVTQRIDVAAGTDPTTAFTFDRAFAAKPIVLSIVRDDDTGLDVAFSPSITSLATTGGTLRLKGTTGVIMTFNVTFVGNYINPTAYLRS
jgi:hypothetical protein